MIKIYMDHPMDGRKAFLYARGSRWSFEKPTKGRQLTGESAGPVGSNLSLKSVSDRFHLKRGKIFSPLSFFFITF